MRGCWRSLNLVLSTCLVTSLCVSLSANESKSSGFREILELAGVDTNSLRHLSEGKEFNEVDWRVLLQVFDRLQQFRDLEPALPTAKSLPEPWLSQSNECLGEIYEIEGQIVSVEELPIPENLGQLRQEQAIYHCTFRFLQNDDEATRTAHVLTSRIPQAWQAMPELRESVKIRGALVRVSPFEDEWHPLLLTNHLAWYPTANAPTGMLLLAKNGMDVALLDEVVHRQPFVKPEISREGEAFYSGLEALQQANSDELLRLAKANIGRVAGQWQARQPELRRKYQTLTEEMAQATDEAARQKLQSEVRRARTQRDLAATIAKQAAASQSSVATMFLQPKREVGELFYFEGTARRAVRIAVADDSINDAYYELEVFPSESRLLGNRPVVCCMVSLPANFPTGDAIREPVRIAGVFFKSWRYRSRNLIEQKGATGPQQQLYTPVLLGQSPMWLCETASGNVSWAIGGGIAFLTTLILLWIYLVGLARRDRRAREMLRPTETIDL